MFCFSSAGSQWFSAEEWVSLPISPSECPFTRVKPEHPSLLSDLHASSHHFYLTFWTDPCMRSGTRTFRLESNETLPFQVLGDARSWATHTTSPLMGWCTTFKGNTHIFWLRPSLAYLTLWPSSALKAWTILYVEVDTLLTWKRCSSMFTTTQCDSGRTSRFW